MRGRVLSDGTVQNGVLRALPANKKQFR